MIATYTLYTPIQEEDIRKLRVNDVIYITGTMVTARDQAHRRAIEWRKDERPLPFSLEGLVVFHCGPVIRKQDEKWVAIAAGPTTSTRMEAYTDEIINAFKPRVIVGKGGMGKRTADAMAKQGAVYCAFTGGAAVLATKAIRRVVDVQWLDLGMPEATWIFEVEQFGPLIVAIDSTGKNLFADVCEKVKANKKQIYQKLDL